MYFITLFLCVGFAAADYCSDALPKHNDYRAKHRSPALKCNSVISSDAQKYADKLAVNCDTQTHSQNPSYGENLYAAGASNTNPAESTMAVKAVDSWYNEVNCYNYDKPGYNSCINTTACKKCVTGHFTAVVWKNTTELGVGVAKCKTKKNGFYYTIVVANYKAPGNNQREGQFKANVLKP